MPRYLSSLLLTITLLIWVAGYILFVILTTHAVPQDKSRASDAIVVLTGGNYRTQTGLRLFAEGLASELMFTGVNKLVTEKEIRALWKDEKPLPDCCITLGHQATTTLENAQETKAWLDTKRFKTIRLVTSTYHLQRALMEFHTLMPEIEIIINPVEDEDYTITEPGFWLITFSEYNKLILRGIILTVQKGLT